MAAIPAISGGSFPGLVALVADAGCPVFLAPTATGIGGNGAVSACPYAAAPTRAVFSDGAIYRSRAAIVTSNGSVIATALLVTTSVSDPAIGGVTGSISFSDSVVTGEHSLVVYCSFT